MRRTSCLCVNKLEALQRQQGEGCGPGFVGGTVGSASSCVYGFGSELALQSHVCSGEQRRVQRAAAAIKRRPLAG